MSIPTSRATGDAQVTIDRDTCTACGLCARVCGGLVLVMRDGAVECDPSLGLGCMGCAQCMTVCPTGAITVSGCDVEPEDALPLPRARIARATTPCSASSAPAAAPASTPPSQSQRPTWNAF